MFGLFSSQESKMRRNAVNWLELADKVWALRRDVLPAGEAEVLRRKREELRQSVRARADAAKLKLQIEELEGALRQSGGAVYPKTALVENVEFFLVAAIVILGIRTYFLQPFKIPTNSMWPSYYGMTAENFPPPGPAPTGLARLLRLAAYGAVRHEADAPRAGQVSALFYNQDIMAYTLKKGRSWLVFPTDLREYTFFVDGEPVKVDVPADFGQGADEHAGSFEDIVVNTYFGGRKQFNAYWDQAQKTAGFPERSLPGSFYAGARIAEVPLGRTVQKGEPVLRFDVLTGDQLFVDRFTYHFFPPKIGQGFVFRTDNIEGIAKEDYYIKRLVGAPGDRIEVRPPVLYRNGQPITGAKAFENNAHQVAPYTGYTKVPEAYRPPGWDSGMHPSFYRGEGPVVIPDDGYFAMGDNSSNSLDGRYWGVVPRDSVIGRPLFIYYPFTRRWGPAH